MRKQPRQQRSQQMVTDLVEACARVIAREGLPRLSTNLIAAEAGVSVGSLYQYFDCKEALVEALLDRMSQDLVGVIRDNASALLAHDVHAAVERLLDRKAAEIVAAGTKGLFTEEGIDDIGALMKLRGRGRSSAARVMLHLRSARGSAIPCEGRAADHRNDPTVEGLVLVLHDMRPKQELAGAYDQSLNDVEVLLGHTGEALFLVDTTFCLRAFSRVAAVRTKRWLGKELKAGMSIYDLARPERKAGLEAVYARVLA